MIILAFLLSTTFLIIQAIFLPQISLLAFSPFLSLSLLKNSRAQALALSLLAGMLMDLISNDPMGLHALNYVLVTALLFKIKRHFLYEDPFHFSLVTAIFSSLSTVFQLLLLFLFDRRVALQGRWILTDVLGMPVMDGLYAFVWFTAPLALYSRLKQLWDLFWLKRKKISRTSR